MLLNKRCWYSSGTGCKRNGQQEWEVGWPADLENSFEHKQKHENRARNLAYDGDY